MADYDVIVVGAGCAGPAAAKKAAELGLKTLLLEKAAVPGQKNVSGTCLNTAALVDPDLHYLMDGPVEREIREMRTYHIASDRTTVIHEIPAQGILLLSVRRDEFDAWHTEQARLAGATVQLATSVVDILESEGRLRGVITDKGGECSPGRGDRKPTFRRLHRVLPLGGDPTQDLAVDLPQEGSRDSRNRRLSG
jgi:electron transfer flavoprotein-quinone oxidoreductase